MEDRQNVSTIARDAMLVHMIGNAHIDPVWLWPWQSGADEALATLSSAADRCDEYPDFVFTRGEAWVYRQAEQIRPDLFARIRKLIERGQWHITGGQYIQPDLNLPTEAGLRRQLVHGQRYFRDKFGITPTIGYNVDSFGHTASLPDILADHGYTAYVFRRPEQHQVALPANTFVWQGVKGGEVVAFRINPGYVSNFADLTGQVELAIEAADPALGHTMCFYGVGNHGGGPSKAMIEWIIANRRSFAGHELVFSTPQAFFSAIAGERDRLPRVTTELQHTFPGCYSVMHDIKSTQRHGEQLLDQAERAATAFATNASERQDHVARLDAAWDDLLFTEFHDILTGTSIPSAWGSVRAMQGRARIVGEEVLFEATRRWSYSTLPRVDEHQIVVVNTGDRPFKGIVEAEPYLDFDDWRQRWLSDEAGDPVPVQEVQPDSSQMIPRIIFSAEVGPAASRQFQVRNDPRPPIDIDGSAMQATPEILSNGIVTIALGDGGVSQIRVGDTDLLGTNGISLHLRRDTTDTWTFHTDRWEEPVLTTLADEAWRVEETGPIRVRAHLEGRLGNSRIGWTISLCRGESRIAVALDVNFDERFILLQMPFDLAQPPSRWTDGLAGGRVDRRPSASEWPFLGWSRLTVGDYDVGLVTDDFYSHSVDGSVWQPTLLRSPKMAWGGGEPATYAGRDHHTDQGVHRFAFDLRFGNQLDVADLATDHHQHGQPLVVFDRYEGMNRPAWGPVPPRGLWGPAMQRNLEQGRIADPGTDDHGGLFKRPGHDYAG
jgi:alpha-mannosidase